MKKAIFGLLMLLVTADAFAAGTWALPVYHEYKDEGVRIMVLSWTADAAAATIPSYAWTASDKRFTEGYNLYMIVTDPGSTAPTALYDITLTDQYGFDVSGGTVANRSATVTEQVVPAITGSVYGGRTIDSTGLTVAISGNVVNSATGKIVLFFGK